MARDQVDTELAKRLNLGCGEYTMEGFINVDIQPPADELGDFTQMEFTEVDEVVMSHILEHLSWQMTAHVLALVRSWMKVGATLTVEVPDMSAVLARGVYDTWAEVMIYGIQSAPGEFHAAGFTLDKLSSKVEAAGFTIVTGRTFVTEHPARKGLPCIEVVGAAR